MPRGGRRAFGRIPIDPIPHRAACRGDAVRRCTRLDTVPSGRAPRM